MIDGYSLLVMSGIWAVIFGYTFRYVWPMSTLVIWQTLLGPVVRAMGAKLPEDSKEFFYAPKVGEPLAFHFFHPNHQIAIPTLFTVGACIGYVIASVGEQGYEAMTWCFFFVATILFIWRGWQGVSSRDSIAVGLERIFFTVSSFLEIALVFTVVRQAINT